MRIEISSTEAVRRIGECLARVKDWGDSFVIPKDGEPVAELVAVSGVRRGTWEEVAAALEALPHDPAFAEDLARVNEADQLSKHPRDC